MDPAAFCTLLRATLSPDAGVRKDAESRIEEGKKVSPDLFVSSLLETLSSHPDEEVRLQAAVLLRSTAFAGALEGEKHLWPRLSPQTQEKVKTTLLLCMEREGSARVRSNVCDTTADLACQLIPADQWSSLGPQLVSLINTNDPLKQQGALHVLSEVIPALSTQLGEGQQGKQLGALVRGCLGAATPAQTRAEALSLLVALAEDGQRSVYRKIGTADSPVSLLVVSAVEAALRQAGTETRPGETPDFQLAERLIGLVIQLFEADRGGGAGLFKGHVSVVLDYILGLANAGKSLPSLAARAQAAAAAADAAAAAAAAGGAAPAATPSVAAAACAATAEKAEGLETLRKLAIEALLSYGEQKPRTLVGCTDTLREIVNTLLRCMLEAEGEEYEAWFESGEEADDEQRMYDIGEEGLDRLARCFQEEDEDEGSSSRQKVSLSAAANVLPLLSESIREFLTKDQWSYRFVAMMAIAQTVEYIPQGEEQQLAAVADTIATALRDGDYRVRFAACQCLGQLALDHAPTVQHEYADVLLEPLLACFADPTPRVRGHACAAFVNFAEELEKSTMKQIVDNVMPRVLALADTSSPLLVRQHAITCIAVIAGVLEKDFSSFYSSVLPALMVIIKEPTPQGPAKETMLLNSLRCKAIEAASIVGYSVGREMFAPESGFVMEQLLQLFNATDATAVSDPSSSSSSSSSSSVEAEEDREAVREYLTEAISRLCRVMETDFIPYLGRLLPKLFAVLSLQPKEISTDELATSHHDDDQYDDMTYVMVDAGKSLGLRTSLLEEQERALELLNTIFSVLAKPLAAAAAVPSTADEVRSLMVQSGQAVTPLLRYVLSESVKERALEATASLLMGLALAPQLADIKRALLIQILTDVFASLDDPDADAESMQAEAAGLQKCIEAAGGDVLDAHEVGEQAKKVLGLLEKSSERRIELAAKRHVEEDLEDDDLSEIEADEEIEQTLRSSLVELLGSLMQSHPAQFVGGPAMESALAFAEANLRLETSNDDKAVGLFVCCDILQHLKEGAINLWPRFLPRLLECLLAGDQRIQQAAAYGVQQAAKIAGFASYAPAAASNVLRAIAANKDKRGKLQVAATDNAIAALGDLVEYLPSALGGDLTSLTSTWLELLPLKHDNTEGLRVHKQLMKALKTDRHGFFSGDLSRVSRALGVFAGVYKTSFADSELEAEIVSLFAKIQASGEPAPLEQLASGFNPKQTKRLSRILKDAASAA